MKIGPQAKIDNFAFKNSNIIIEAVIYKRKDYFPCKKTEAQNKNVFNKFYSCPNFISYRYIPNFKKWYDSNKSRTILPGKRFFTTSPFLSF